MTALRVPSDIVSLRMNHCRAELAAKEARYHLAALHYRTCLEAAEVRQDAQATRFFALRLGECYEAMGQLWDQGVLDVVEGLK